MDPLTHALSGALLARAAARFPAQPQSERKVLPLRMQVMAGFAAAAFPDVDFALRLIDTLTYLNWHQGPTHSLILLPLWTWLLARLFSWFTSERYPWKLFALPVCLGIAIHIVGDLITSYGLMLFSPLSTERFSLPLVFVIDPWFSLIIIVGLVLS
ncbi:MAG: metal-dependent hydrolase [Nitrosomonas sp.]|nr:metal-dependent hydrolase [Nitrosomonas sp.]